MDRNFWSNKPVSSRCLPAQGEPATSGQGVFFDVVPSSGILLMGWCTYAELAEGLTSKVGADEHNWLSAQSPYDQTIANLTITLTKRGVFDDPTPPFTAYAAALRHYQAIRLSVSVQHTYRG